MLAAIAVYASPAPALDPALRPSQYVQRSWTTEDGLPQNSVIAISQTADGSLWIGTEQGLARFDGSRFVSIEIRTADGRLDGLVSALWADGDVLWAGTDRGLYRFVDGAATAVSNAGGQPVTGVVRIAGDGNGRLWVLTRSRLLWADVSDAGTFTATTARGLMQPTNLTIAPNGRPCVIDGRVLCFDGVSFVEPPYLEPAELPQKLEALAFDGSGNLWIGTIGDGLLRTSQAGIEHVGEIKGLPQDIVLGLGADRSGDVWVGFASLTVARAGPRGIELLDLGTHPSNLGVTAFFEDREGSLWIGTGGDGLIQLSDPLATTISTAEGLSVPAVRSVLVDREGTVWIGTAGGGLHRIVDGAAERVDTIEGLTSDDVISLAEDSRGRLWVGTGGQGAWVRDGGRFTAVPGASIVVLSMTEDQQGRMWAGGLGVVQRHDGERFSAVDELRGIVCPAMIAEDDGTTWIANWDGELVRWRAGEVIRLGADEGFPETMTVAVYQDSRGVVWIGSHLGGLTRVDGDDVFTYTTAHGLCDDSAFSIVEGPEGRLWLSSNTGIFTVPLDQLDAVAAGQRDTVDCRLFGTADGMRSSECNGGQQPAAWRDQEDALWFATTDGVVRIDPAKIDEPPPPVRIEKIVSGGRALRPRGEDELSLPREGRETEIRFTAVTLRAADQVSFRYRLEGLDQDWVEVGHRRVAFFTNLAPRHYRFVVQARRPGGAWGDNGTAVAFRLEPRFFETWWFLGLMLIGVVGLALTAHLTRVASIHRNAQRLEALVAERTAELAEVNDTLERRIEEGVEALRESDRMAAYGHLVAGVAHEIRHPIFAIRTAAHLLTTKLAGRPETQQELEILELETEQMNQLVDDLLELGKPRQLELAPVDPAELVEAAATSITGRRSELRIETSVDPSVPEVLADRPAIIQVLVNLLDNAIRHATGAGCISVGVAVADEPGTVHFTVADDGPGLSITEQTKIFEPFYSGSDGTGLGLAIASRLVRGHGGRLRAGNRPDGGAVFTIVLQAARQSC